LANISGRTLAIRYADVPSSKLSMIFLYRPHDDPTLSKSFREIAYEH
jgi:hypothetical protein